jgi:flagellar hook protein FlgE
MPFRIALSGLNAASADLKVTGNNVANAGTYGFKSSRTEFADVFASTFGGASGAGGGVRVAAVMQEFEQGTIDFTGNSLDMAINGGGFFVLSDGGTRVYSRAGAFLVDKDGFVVNSQNQRLQVFPPLDEAGTTFNTASPTDVQLSLDQGAPQATTGVNASLNLRADAEDLGAGAIDPADPDTFSYSTSATIYDSLGASHTATLYFRKTGTNTWDVRTDIDGAAATVGGQNQTTLAFNADGSLASGGTIAYDAFTPANGAAPLALTAELAGTTQFGGSFSVASLTQDGFASGRLSGVQIDEAGVIFARYTNGQSRAMGKVALANFPNPNGLQQLGDNAWAATFQAGTAQMGEAGTGSFGAIQSGGLESSNVDIAEQLVNLITAQRNFQANAQVITTADSVTQTIINLR